jgi:hypothetical protein
VSREHESCFAKLLKVKESVCKYLLILGAERPKNRSCRLDKKIFVTFISRMLISQFSRISGNDAQVLAEIFSVSGPIQRVLFLMCKISLSRARFFSLIEFGPTRSSTRLLSHFHGFGRFVAHTSLTER